VGKKTKTDSLYGQYTFILKDYGTYWVPFRNGAREKM